MPYIYFHITGFMYLCRVNHLFLFYFILFYCDVFVFVNVNYFLSPSSFQISPFCHPFCFFTESIQNKKRFSSSSKRKQKPLLKFDGQRNFKNFLAFSWSKRKKKHSFSFLFSFFFFSFFFRNKIKKYILSLSKK